MKYLGKGIGTVGVWIGVLGSLSILSSFEMLSPLGSAFIVFGGFVCTTQIWIDAEIITAYEKSGW